MAAVDTNPLADVNPNPPGLMPAPKPVDKFERLPENGLSVLIVGGGVAGYTSALEFYRKGCSVRVLERSPELSFMGDAFNLGLNGRMWIRNYPELSKEVYELSKIVPYMCVRKHDGEAIGGPAPMRGPPGAPKLNEAPMAVYSRSGFTNALYRECERQGIPVTFGARVMEYYEKPEIQKGGVVLKDGTKLEADLVIAADGLHSVSQNLITDPEFRSKHNGLGLLRAACPMDIAMANPQVKKMFGCAENGHAQENWWTGNSTYAVIHTMPEMLAWIIVHRASGNEEESWHYTVSAESAMEALKEGGDEWHEAMKELIRVTPKNGIGSWPMILRTPSAVTSSKHGRVVQMGDCAHPFLPSSAFGATAAIEDAITLASTIHLAGKDQIPLAVDVHKKIRFERTALAQTFGLFQMQKWRFPNWEAAKKDPSVMMPKMMKWLTFHNPEAYVYEVYDKVVDHLKTGAPFENGNIPPGVKYQPWNVEEIVRKFKTGEPVADLTGWN